LKAWKTNNGVFSIM